MGYRFYGPFLSSFGNENILLDVNYVSKWAKIILTRTNDATVVVKFLRENILLDLGYLELSLVINIHALLIGPLMLY